jgi:hypothetical protein
MLVLIAQKHVQWREIELVVLKPHALLPVIYLVTRKIIYSVKNEAPESSVLNNK